MSTDINTKVLAAFQVEHKEQLEGIRSLLDKLKRGDGALAQDGIDEAFRLAHSLKGGARVCDLQPAETLGHGLENVFAHVREGTVQFDEGVARTIDQVLDAIEDWMAALERGEDPADPQDALAAIQHLLAADQPVGATANAADDVNTRLRQAFRSECQQYLADLKRIATKSDGGELTDDDLAEAFRFSHNLRGAAQAADVHDLADVSRQLETLTAGLCDHSIALDQAALDTWQECLSAVEAATMSSGHTSNAGGPTASESDRKDTRDRDVAARESGDQQISPPTTPVDRRDTPVDTVRITTQSLDRLLRSSRQLLTDGRCHDQIGKELDELRREVNEMQRERESIRRVAASSLHRLATAPEFGHVARYLDAVDRGVQSFARRTRQICQRHRHNAWTLQSHGRQIQQDVRQARMVPAEAVFQGLRKCVRDLAKQEGKNVDFQVSGLHTRADRMVFQALKDPLIHILRNCIVHGIESPDERTERGKPVAGKIVLTIDTVGNRLKIEVDDDGRGIDVERIRAQAAALGLLVETDDRERSRDELASMIFQPGFTTSEQVTKVAGRGMGLSVVHETASRLQGEARVCPKDGAGATIQICVPLSVSTHRLLLVTANGQTFAIPLYGIERLLRIKPGDLKTVEGKPIVTFRDQPIPLVSLGGVLAIESGPQANNNDAIVVAILKSSTRRIAIAVDALVAEQDLLIQDLDAAAESPQFLGAIILEDGTVSLVLNPNELFEREQPVIETLVAEASKPVRDVRTQRVLVVDDSFTTRTLEKSILEAHDYEVAIAVDGVQALNQLRRENFDLVISDVEMPHMDGFTLLEEIKKDRRLSSTPVILVTSRDRREDQQRGLDLGADAYIVKRKFDHQELLSTIRQIV